MAKDKFVPFEKLSKKEKRRINKEKRSDSFGCNMITKVVPNKRKAKREEAMKRWQDYSD